VALEVDGFGVGWVGGVAGVVTGEIPNQSAALPLMCWEKL